MVQSGVQVSSDGAVQASLTQVRNGELEWVVLGFENDKSETLTFVASGHGSVEALREHFVPRLARFALIRYTHQQSGLPQTKYALIDWTPSDARPMRKARLSTLRGSVHSVIGAAHINVTWSDVDDIDEAIITDKISIAAGTKVNVKSAAEARAMREEAQKKAAKAAHRIGTVPAVPKTTVDNLRIHTEDLKKAIADVMNDSCSIDWMMATYENDNTFGTVQCGTGGVEALLNGFEEARDQITYGVFRINQTVDKSVLVKFVLVAMVPMSIRPGQRARMSTHRGRILDAMQPFHYKFDISSPSELSRERVEEHIAEMTGQACKVREHVEKVEATRVVNPDTKFVKRQVSEQRLKFVDEQECRAALASVHSDVDATTWAQFALSDSDVLEAVAKGTGAVEDLLSAHRPGAINFGVLRVVDKIDEHDTVKFVLIGLQPETIGAFRKAHLATMLGEVRKFFEPYHVDMFISSADEISNDEVLNRVSDMSGSKSKEVDISVLEPMYS